MDMESWITNHGEAIMEEKSRGELMEKESWMRNIAKKPWKRNHGGGIMEDSWRSHCGGDIWRDLGPIREPSGSHLGNNLGAFWEPLGAI